MSLYRNQLEAWLGKLNVSADRLLDLGGAANPVLKRLQSAKVVEYLCLDKGVEDAKVSFIQFDINLPLEQLQGVQEKDFRFDAIFCLEVFEYVWNPVQAMQNIARMLMEGGLAYVSFPAIYPVHNPVEIDYLRYTQKAIERLCSEVGLKILEIVPRRATEGQQALSTFYSQEGMHPVRNSSLPFDIGYMVRLTKDFKEDHAGN